MSEKLARHRDILDPVLEELRQALILVINEQGGTEELVSAIENLRRVRQIVNNEESIGFVVAVEKWLFSVFPLSLDPKKDLGQIPSKTPKNKIN